MPPKTSGLIHAYGTFWDRDRVDWSPGSGSGRFRVLGRRNKRKPQLQVCDIRDQRGIYVLHDDHGAYYVGLATDRGIGIRLRDHTKDHHKNEWTRFSWYGFRVVLTGTNTDGTQKLRTLAQGGAAKPRQTIGDLEALLIEVTGTHRAGNRQRATFSTAAKWEQIDFLESDQYLNRIRK